MTTTTIDITDVTLFNNLRLANVSTVDFVLADLATSGLLQDLADSYVDVLLNRYTTFEPLGRQLRRWANTNVKAVRAALDA